MSDRLYINVRLCPAGEPTRDVTRPFLTMPHRGESLIADGRRYVIVEIDWHEDGSPFVIAHGADRPRAVEALRRAS